MQRLSVGRRGVVPGIRLQVARTAGLVARIRRTTVDLGDVPTRCFLDRSRRPGYNRLPRVHDQINPAPDCSAQNAIPIRPSLPQAIRAPSPVPNGRRHLER